MTKSDHYLSLCLSQAALSPLRYRHGCIIVRGGKVIGAGHNDYRPGYDGGALKTGVLPKQQQHPKHLPNAKRKPKNDTNRDRSHSPSPSIPQQPTAGNAFTPFEEIGGTAPHAVTAPFSMHSEMMAVVDAAGRLRGAAARKALEGQKPRPKLPRAGKSLDKSGGFNGVVEEDGRAGGHGQRQHHRRQERAASEAEGGRSGSGKDWKSKKKYFKDMTTRTGLNTTASYRTPPIKRATTSDQPAGLKNHAILHPKSKTGTAISSFTVQDRMKYRCLVGADLYVARLGNHSAPLSTASAKRAEESLACVEGKKKGEKELALPPRTSSLHDELTNKTAAVATAAAVTKEAQGEAPFDRSNVVASKPCYRCVSFMHNVGIKRVFWTNDEGMWEGAKVRDLVDQLEGVGCQNGCAGEEESVGSGVYVTRHEVLMLRRLLGGS